MSNSAPPADAPAADPVTTTLPILPLRNTVLFPRLVVPLAVGRPASVAAVEATLATEDKTLVIVSQKDTSIEEAGFADLFPIGAKAVIKKMERSEDVVQIIVQGMERVELITPQQEEPFLTANVRTIPLPDDWDTETEALHRSVLELAGRILEMINPNAQQALAQMVREVEQPLHQVFLLSSILTLTLDKEQALLAARTQADALRLMHDYLSYEAQVVEVRQKIASQAQSEMTREQREYVLRQQLRAIQEELGEQSSEQADVAELRRKVEEADLPDEVRKEADRELSRLERLPSAAPDYQLTRTYLELISELPWRKQTEDSLDLANARTILDEDHYGLEEVKDRIIEHLAVMKLNPQAHAPILCFVGPPGVGKTSLGQSIARALGREFTRMSLGGLSDEAELRGHRRTYIGAMPGRIIQAIRRTEVCNPLLMLDEVDKLGRDFRGDPAAALLEILDPAQNFEFRDNYLDLAFDLSRVFFIATANTLDTVPGPLLDRLEVLRLSGYSDDEKLHIARRYLVERRLKDAGLKPENVTIPDETLLRIARRYTREAGVRDLERTIGRVCRKLATRVAEGDESPVTVGPDDLTELLGPEKFFEEDARTELAPGVAPGLAYTPVGGEVLYIEAVLLSEGEGLMMTGQLGDVMKESAQAARSYVRSQAEMWNLDREAVKFGVHLHVPAGATPKDGPSAGVTMAAALASLYSHQPVRSDTAMTGEITLSGLVLPVGGIKEKVLAAHRSGLRRLILPRQNQKDVADLPENVREDLEFIYAERIDDVLAAAIPAFAEQEYAMAPA